MELRNKGQIDMKIVFIMIIVLVIMGIVSFLATNQFLQEPLSYPQAWERWSDETFKSQNQPWRMLALFFLPFVLYFSVNYLAFSITYLGAARIYGKSELQYIYKPILLICFVVAMLMLPSPVTFSLSGWFMGLSGMLPIFVIIFIGLGLPLTFVFVYAMAQQVRSRLPTVPRREEEEERRPTPIGPTPPRIEIPEPPEAPDIDLSREVLNVFRNYNRQVARVIQNIINIR